MIAIAISGLILVSLIGLFLLTGVSSVFGLNRARATQIAESELTRHKFAGFSTLEGYLGAPPAPVHVSEGGVTFQQSVSVQRLSATVSDPEHSLLRVTVAVDWLERRTMNIQGNHAQTKEAPAHLELTSVLGEGSQY